MLTKFSQLKEHYSNAVFVVYKFNYKDADKFEWVDAGIIEGTIKSEFDKMYCIEIDKIDNLSFGKCKNKDVYEVYLIYGVDMIFTKAVQKTLFSNFGKIMTSKFIDAFVFSETVTGNPIISISNDDKHRNPNDEYSPLNIFKRFLKISYLSETKIKFDVEGSAIVLNIYFSPKSTSDAISGSVKYSIDSISTEKFNDLKTEIIELFKKYNGIVDIMDYNSKPKYDTSAFDKIVQDMIADSGKREALAAKRTIRVRRRSLKEKK